MYSNEASLDTHPPDIVTRISLAEDALENARISLKAAKTDCSKQTRRVDELNEKARTVATVQERGDYARQVIHQLHSIENEPNLSRKRRSDRIRALIAPIAEWSSQAEALITMIDLETFED
jgi:hypothetical protein